MEVFEASLPLDLSHLSSLRRQLSEWLGGVQVSDDVADEVLLATHEAAANAIEHAEPATLVTIKAVRPDDKLMVIVTNSGAWSQPRSVNEMRGRGLILMRTVMSKVEIRVHSGRTTVRMRKDLSSNASPADQRIAAGSNFRATASRVVDHERERSCHNGLPDPAPDVYLD